MAPDAGDQIDPYIRFVWVAALALADALHLDHFGPWALQQLAFGGVCNSFLLYRGVPDHAGQFLLGDQLEGDSRLHVACEQFFHSLLVQGFAKPSQLCRVAWPVALKM